MASKKFEKGSPEWEMFSEYWKLCQKFWVPEDNEQYWGAVIKEMNSFYEKYKIVDRIFVMKLSLAYINALEKKKRE